MHTTFKVKEVKKAHFGKVKIASNDNKEFLFSLIDISRLFNINYNNAITKIGSMNIVGLKTKTKDKKEQSVLFTNTLGLTECLKLSTEEKADIIYEWLINERNMKLITFEDISAEDLKDTERATYILKKIIEYKMIIEVQNLENEEHREKAKFYDTLFGKLAPLELSLVPQRIRYKNISLQAILELLRSAGIFNESNEPDQKYIDSLHFRFIKTKTTIKGTERVMTKILVYKKGLTLIEDLIRKKAGKKWVLTKK